MNELVSIITPSYNTAQFIAQTIHSVQSQTYTNWEMIIVDDCSTDNTDEVVKQFLVDERIRYLKNEKNSGAAVSRNRALQVARGRWVAFLDSDDLWEPDKLEKQIGFMKKNGYQFSYTNYIEIDEDGKVKGSTWTGPKVIGNFVMHTFNYMGCLTVMYDRNYVGLIQVADIKKRNDYAMWIKVAKKCPAYLLDETLAMYRIRATGSIMNRSKSPLSRMKYNFILWRESEKMTVIGSVFWTGINLVYGAIKKIIYKRQEL